MTNTQSTPKSPGRPGLQRKDVADAIDALGARGIRDPSLNQLRQHLGRGSNGTISRLRNEIRGERLLATRAPAEGSVESAVLPVLVSAMERLGEEAARAADEQITDMRSTFEAAQSKLSRERDEAVSAAHDIRIELTARADQVKDLRETIKALRAEISDAKKRLDRSEDARRTLEDWAHTLEVDTNRLNEARHQLELSLSEKSDALAQASNAQKALQSEVATLAVTNADLESALNTRTEAIEASRSLIEKLRDAQTALEQRAVTAEQGRAAAEAASAATIASLEAGLADRQRTIESLIEKIGD